ncbi:hypothetical protein ASD8599_01728 [Ascidiaceihabitans donghaensis]|uniref:Uncharacterized protein n=1 Tax=Ascidiaceihabitans donghaensis TaxID=1510460 RepID=A0A2R8BD23_9RHOB|nr:phage tail tube protein [Ascidiaceihabitans donghaensis]SPH20987.1 hypothetical protein ASD8599_01728 [Ascidiaceihabitans donghaensis]
MSLKWNSKILLAKIEATYGVDATPTAAQNAILAKEVSFEPMAGSDVSRDLETSFLGGQGSVPIDLHAKLSFKVELVGSGAAGTPPAWGPLMRGCGVAETITAGTSVVYNPVSDGHESLSTYFQVEGTQHVIKGTRGTCTLDLSSSAIPYLNFEFTGLFTRPTEEARANPDLSGFMDPLPVNNANTPVFTVDGTSLTMRSFMLNLGNEIAPRFLVGEESILITDREDSVETKVVGVDLGTFDPYGLALDQAEIPIVLKHGTQAGNIIQIDVARAQMQRLQGLENAQKIMEWPLRLSPIPDAGNDQWTLTLT